MLKLYRVYIYLTYNTFHAQNALLNIITVILGTTFKEKSKTPFSFAVTPTMSSKLTGCDGRVVKAID